MSLPTATCWRCRTSGVIRAAQRQGSRDPAWHGVFLCNACTAQLDARYRHRNGLPAASERAARVSDLYPD